MTDLEVRRASLEDTYIDIVRRHEQGAEPADRLQDGGARLAGVA